MSPFSNGHANEARSLRELQHEIAELLDKVCVRGADFAVQSKLRALESSWVAAAGDPEGVSWLRKAQGAVGMANCSPSGDPLHNRAMTDLVELKQQLRNLARGKTS